MRLHATAVLGLFLSFNQRWACIDVATVTGQTSWLRASERVLCKPRCASGLKSDKRRLKLRRITWSGDDRVQRSGSRAAFRGRQLG